MADGEEAPDLETEATAEDQDGQEGEQESQDEGEPEYLFGDEAAPASGERETGLVKHLRDEIRKRDAIIAERPSPQAPKLGPKPTLANCDYDEERFEVELDAWKEDQTKARAHETAQEQESREAREEWARDQEHFRASAANLKVPNFEEAETLVLGSLNQFQHVALIKGAKDPAALTLALSRRPDKLAELAQIKDPFKAVAHVARLEGALKVMPRRQQSEPEEIATGSASIGFKGDDKKLAALERKAELSGDRTEVQAYKRSLRKS